ncbi:host-nuclease inhibitor Gam family protein [Levilactobacillus namurensis]|uniref:host-nuclease inhibitor Gam family protein n=1 Tax=Levilactobacillus namurensis TaxID=380393 RepID=UPI001DA34842|nr:host-nuclease inhibitor Gam family protein [Levilactobacillus namurensis]HJE44442.1 host-nuclease inhibitor Gam family protein [Levilactobacillus namurensis]
MMNALDNSDFEEAKQTKPSFQVTDLDSATWAMRKYRALTQKDDEIKRTAQTQIESIEEWRDKQLAANQDSRSFFEGLLGDYLTELRQTDPKAKVSTPYGSVYKRKSPSGVNWSDEAVVQSLERQGLTDLIKTTKKPDKSAIKKQFTFQNGRYINSDGQVLDGATEKESVENTVVKPVKGLS